LAAVPPKINSHYWMKIAIIGTRGIPNHYGGFEQLAENLSVMLKQKGHVLTVYNSSLHPYKENNFNGVTIVHCKDPEDSLGTAGQFIYDLNCIRHCRKQNYDIILQLGYTSSSVWSFLFPKSAKVITNMDGLEWKRSKYNTITKRFLRAAEKWAVHHSAQLIADSIGIQHYLLEQYKAPSHFIPYGAAAISTIDEPVLKAYDLRPFSYYLVIARLEPENNIATIIQGYLKAGLTEPLVIIGSTKTPFGKKLKAQYASALVQLTEGIYDLSVLDQLRYHSKLYFHGHSVGGTNPSLLEAMASKALICAHQNVFNHSVLGKDALYFTSDDDICQILKNENSYSDKERMLENNLIKIKATYTWKAIADAYENVFINA
jgi:glycosyltransferase involved in cell wall biosynthesis